MEIYKKKENVIFFMSLKMHFEFICNSEIVLHFIVYFFFMLLQLYPY